jgi:hypothetical protein
MSVISDVRVSGALVMGEPEAALEREGGRDALCARNTYCIEKMYAAKYMDE